MERKSITEHLSACDFGIHVPGLDHALISLRFSPLQGLLKWTFSNEAKENSNK